MAGYSYIRSNAEIHVPYSTFPSRLKKWAEEIPEKEAVVFVEPNQERKAVTFGKLYTDALALAKGLVNIGIVKGDVIGIAGPNTPEWLVSTFGAQMAGASPLHFTFCKPWGVNIVDILNLSGRCRMIISDPGLEDENLEILTNIIGSFLNDGAVKSDTLPDLKWVILQQKPKSSTFMQTVHNIISTENSDVQLPLLDPEDIAAIFLTSGSTDIPKCVPYTHYSLLISGFNADFLLTQCGRRVYQREIHYNDRSFFWIAGYPLWEIYSGGTRVTHSNLLTFTSLSDTVNYALSIIESESVTSALLVPPYLHYLLQKKDVSSKQRTICTGGMLVSSSYLKCIGHLCENVLFVYAGTEFGTVASNIYSSNAISNYDFLVGQAMPGTEIKVVDKDGALLPVNHLGEIYVRSPVRFSGYLNNEDKTKRVLSTSGWYKTEDCGLITEDNMLLITGRMCDVIHVCGIKVSPSVIEHILKNHPDVLDAVVFGNKDEETQNDVPCAAIVRKAGSGANAKMLKEYIRTMQNIKQDSFMLEGFFVPKFITFFEQFPKLATGKVNRKAIQQSVKDDVAARRCLE